MDLYAYSKIKNLEGILKELNIHIQRLRGLRLMKDETAVTSEKINKLIRDSKIDLSVRWLNQHSWNCWSSSKDNKKHPAFIYGVTQEEWEDEPTRKVIDIDFSKVHGRDRKELKLAYKKIEIAINKQFNLFNEYAGKDVLYVHARQGGSNRVWCKMADLARRPLYLGDADDYFDSTYCDIYFDISKFDLKSFLEKKDKLPSPKRGTSILEKIEFYHNLIAEGLDVEELKVVRSRIYKLKHDDNNADEDFAIDHILECIKEFLE